MPPERDDQVPETSLEALLSAYPVILLDAYGVLVDATGALPGAREAIDRLNLRGKPYFVLTNDASRLPRTWARRFRSFGLEISADRIITSGSLIAEYFERYRLGGSRSVVLGPADSRAYVEAAGGRVVSPEEGDLDVLLICDEEGYPFLQTADAALGALFARLDGGTPVRLVLPNPDLTYPSGGGGYGFTAGSIALMFEAALERRYGGNAPRFDRLGKPFAPMFEEVVRRSGAAAADLVLIGDQLETDIAGAFRFGIHSALATTGISPAPSSWSEAEARPNYLLRRWSG